MIFSIKASFIKLNFYKVSKWAFEFSKRIDYTTAVIVQEAESSRCHFSSLAHSRKNYYLLYGPGPSSGRSHIIAPQWTGRGEGGGKQMERNENGLSVKCFLGNLKDTTQFTRWIVLCSGSMIC